MGPWIKTASLVFVAAIVGCGADKPAPQVPQQQNDPLPELPPLQEQAVAEAQRETGGGLNLEAEVLQLCPAVKPPKFAYDSSQVDREFRAALVELAKCMTEGKLKGRSLLLVGHADPRGEEDYNMALGGRRADSVRSALTTLGVEKERLDVSSRGEVEAKGSNEGSWAEDRRVDVKIDRSQLSKVGPPKQVEARIDPGNTVARPE